MGNTKETEKENKTGKERMDAGWGPGTNVSDSHHRNESLGGLHGEVSERQPMCINELRKCQTNFKKVEGREKETPCWDS